ncbi:MAG: hypothetical protein Q9202_007628, partial [Teloschistes flavicans]
MSAFIRTLEARHEAWRNYYRQETPAEKPQQRAYTSQAATIDLTRNSNENRPYQQSNQHQYPRNQWRGPRDSMQPRYAQQQPSQQPSQRRLEPPAPPLPPPKFTNQQFNPSRNEPPKNAYHGHVEEVNEGYEGHEDHEGLGNYGDAGDTYAPTPNEQGHGEQGDSQRSYIMGMNFNDSSEVWQGMAPYSCGHCPTPKCFGNSEELRDHVLDFHGQDTRSSTIKYLVNQIMRDEHARDNVHTFQPPRKGGYAMTKGVVFDYKLQPCLDTGSGPSAIDEDLLPRQQYGIVQRCRPVTLKG